MISNTHEHVLSSLDHQKIRNLVQKLNKDNYKMILNHLVSYPTRHSLSDTFKEAATWAREQFHSMGYEQWIEPFSIPGSSGESLNIAAQKQGSSPAPRKLILLTAHLDSINHENDGIHAAAPGADDNASGSAGVLEIARVLALAHFNNDIRFVLFGGEEQGLFGSKHHIEQLTPEDKSRIQAVINMDMIGCLNPPSASAISVLIEADAISRPLMDNLQTAASIYTSLQVETSLKPFDSDHVSFLDAGIPAVLTIEGADSSNPHDHTATDTEDRIHYDLALSILKMNTAVLIQQLELT